MTTNRAAHFFGFLAVLTVPVLSSAQVDMSQHEKYQREREKARNESARQDSYSRPNDSGTSNRYSTPNWKQLEAEDAAANAAEWKARDDYYKEQQSQIQREYQKIQKEIEASRREKEQREKQLAEGWREFRINEAKARAGDVNAALAAAAWYVYMPNERDPFLLLAGDLGRRDAWIKGAILSRDQRGAFLRRMRQNPKPYEFAYAESALLALDQDSRLPGNDINLKDLIAISQFANTSPLEEAAIYAAFIAEPAPAKSNAALSWYREAAAQAPDGEQIPHFLLASAASRGGKRKAEKQLTAPEEISLWQRACRMPESNLPFGVPHLACIKAALLSGKTGQELQQALSAILPDSPRFDNSPFKIVRALATIPPTQNPSPKFDWVALHANDFDLEILQVEALAQIGISSARNPALPEETRRFSRRMAAMAWIGLAMPDEHKGSSTPRGRAWFRARVALTQAIETGEFSDLNFSKWDTEILKIDNLMALPLDYQSFYKSGSNAWLAQRLRDDAWDLRFEHSGKPLRKDELASRIEKIAGEKTAK